MDVYIIRKRISYNKESISVDDLINDSFYEYANEKALAYKTSTYGVNEVYGKYILDYLALDKWVNENHPNSIDIKKADKEYSFIVEDVCRKNDIVVHGTNQWNKVLSFLFFEGNLFLSCLYFLFLFLKIPYKNELHKTQKFSILRTKSGIKKFSKFPDISKEVEDPKSRDSIYRLFSLQTRIKWAFAAYFCARSTKREMNSFYLNNVGPNFQYTLNLYYAKRILYAEVYKLMLDSYFSRFEGCEFYTANNLDRFSVIEDEIASKHNIKTFNIPHGIEYGFRFPKGFSSDVFYAHSQYAADYLNKLYNTTKYVYNKGIISRMFSYNCTKQHEQMIIFFTEPREQNVNVEIINGLLPIVRKLHRKLYIKVHPVENPEYYKDMDVEVFSDYDVSLTGNICISRKSTILLEAIYNNSIPIAIITNPKDQATFNQFPALNAKEIIKTYSVEELGRVISKNIQ